MNAFSTVVKFFQDSGMFIYPSILIMALGLAVAIERFIFLRRARAENRRMWDQMLPLLQNGKFDKAQAVAGSGDVAIGKIVNYGLTRMQSPGRREDFDAAMEEAHADQVFGVPLFLFRGEPFWATIACRSSKSGSRRQGYSDE